MKENLSKLTEKVAYKLWEVFGNDNPLDMWYCAEEIGFYLQMNGIFDLEKLNDIVCSEKTDRNYITFIRSISYIIYKRTNIDKAASNWYKTEQLIVDQYFCDMIIKMSNEFYDMYVGFNEEKGVRSEAIKKCINSNRKKY